MKNIVILYGSPREQGNSAALANRVAETVAGLGGAVQSFRLNRLSYKGCQGCYACKGRLETCVLKDDLTPVLDAVGNADALAIATPVYYGDVTAQVKGFIDRTYSYLTPDYITSSTPCRLAPGKKLLFLVTQGQPDEAHYADVFPRYDAFLSWYGFQPGRLVRACGVGPGREGGLPEEFLTQAEAEAQWLMA